MKYTQPAWAWAVTALLCVTFVAVLAWMKFGGPKASSEYQSDYSPTANVETTIVDPGTLGTLAPLEQESCGEKEVVESCE